jgi:hypothetical protein
MKLLRYTTAHFIPVAVTDIPPQRPPLLNDHSFYTKNCKIAPFITQPKQVRLPSKLKILIDLKVFYEVVHLHPCI